ncbi:methyl-accepting chemotaxis protein [Lysinibacillus parviboronicapiens]|uniref:methyl-accepting chemotaxis protein n=1 Tax=Lysinibacillus parviboronicapiens TaxID=436516 RepID=UPI000D37B101|nr:methyl-accepting chemotaxis protein [Lysinibacillus parviboronicapiens]
MGVLQSLVETLPVFHEVFNNDIAITLNDKDTRKVLFITDGTKVKTQLKVGSIAENTPDFQQVVKGKIIKRSIPTEHFGIPINSEIYPVRENGAVVGVLSLLFPIEAQGKVEAFMESLQSIIQELQSKIHTIAAHSEELSATSESIAEKSRHALENSSRSNEVTDFIKTISKQTNLLGLNASIEAARAGQYGAGFNIVAQEVRKLSSETSTATEQIETSLKTITSNIQALMESVGHIEAASNEQAELVQQFSDAIEKLSDVSGQMAHYVKEVLR